MEEPVATPRNQVPAQPGALVQQAAVTSGLAGAISAGGVPRSSTNVQAGPSKAADAVSGAAAALLPPRTGSSLGLRPIAANEVATAWVGEKRPLEESAQGSLEESGSKGVVGSERQQAGRGKENKRIRPSGVGEGLREAADERGASGRQVPGGVLGARSPQGLQKLAVAGADAVLAAMQGGEDGATLGAALSPATVAKARAVAAGDKNVSRGTLGGDRKQGLGQVDVKVELDVPPIAAGAVAATAAPRTPSGATMCGKAAGIVKQEQLPCGMKTGNSSRDREAAAAAAIAAAGGLEGKSLARAQLTSMRSKRQVAVPIATQGIADVVVLDDSDDDGEVERTTQQHQHQQVCQNNLPLHASVGPVIKPEPGPVAEPAGGGGAAAAAGAVAGATPAAAHGSGHVCTGAGEGARAGEGAGAGAGQQSGVRALEEAAAAVGTGTGQQEGARALEEAAAAVGTGPGQQEGARALEEAAAAVRGAAAGAQEGARAGTGASAGSSTSAAAAALLEDFCQLKASENLWQATDQVLEILEPPMVRRETSCLEFACHRRHNTPIHKAAFVYAEKPWCALWPMLWLVFTCWFNMLQAAING